MIRRILLLAPVLLILVAGFLFWRFWAGPGPTSEPKTVIVAEGASLSRVAQQLDEVGAIRSDARLFRGFARLFGSSDPVQAGEFEIPPGLGASGILDLLQHGRPVQRLVAIPEGMPSVLVHQRLMEIPLLKGPAMVPPEGSILPDTYGYQRGETRAALLGRMQAAMTAELERLWPRRKPTSVVRTREEAITLASIVEKETAKPSERRMVAGVYSNRLRIGMPLGADPTVIYPVTKGRPLGRRILRSELRADNGYNTYVKAGLPLGPIANPGRESLAAVLDPLPTKNLYFVADGTGGHIFAETLQQHNANVARWYAIRRARGEM